MENHYHEIFELPFVDFTLTHFNRWRNLLADAKKNRFKNTTQSGFIQVVYYHLAVRNYKSADWFLSLCNKDDNQVIFLKILLKFNEKKEYESVSHDFFDPTYVSLINLGVTGYMPAMLAIRYVQLKFSTMGYNNKRLDERTILINKLGKIVQNLIEVDADTYNIDILKYTILAIEANVNSDYFDPVAVLCMAQSGSNAALLHFLSLLSTGPYKKLFETPNNKTLFEFKELLMERILEPNYKIISRLLDIYPTLEEQYEETRLRFSVLKCVEQISKCLAGGCEYMGIIESYLNLRKGFVYPKLDAIYKNILLKCYENGFLFYYLYPGGGKFLTKDKCYVPVVDIGIYSEIDNENVTENHVSTMVDFVTNIFWSRELCCKKTNPDLYPFVGNRIFIFCLLLKMNALLWKAAVCVFGINFDSATLSLSQEVLNVYFKSMHNVLYLSHFKGPYFSGHLNDDFVHIITNVLSELSNHETIYLDEMMEEIDVATLDLIRNKCNVVLSAINSGKFNNVYDVVFLLAEIDILSKPYRNKLKLHMKYRPGSKKYLIIRGSFDKKLKSKSLNFST